VSIQHPDTCGHEEAADLIVRYLESIGVNYLFGVPGGAIEPLYNALARSTRRGGLRVVGARHESAAAYMADGYQRESGKLGVCIGTSGPGATNLITGVACAFDNNIPLLVITGQPTITSFGKGALQESSCTGVNVIGMFRHCTKYNSLVSHIDQLETKLVTAILRAQQTPQGPVHLSIPVDVLRAPIARKTRLYNLNQQLSRQHKTYDDVSIDALYEELISSEKPVFFIGNGSAQAIDKIMQVVTICDAQFITTPDAKGLVNTRHPAYRGVFGLGGHASAGLCLRYQQGNIFAIGTGFNELHSGGWNQYLMNNKLVHVDHSLENMAQTPMAHLHVHGTLDTIFSKLLQRFAAAGRLKPTQAKKFFPGLNPNITFEDVDKFFSSSVPIKPQRLMKELSERFPANTRFVADAGNSMMWAPHYLQANNQREKIVLDEGGVLPFKDRRSNTASWLRLTLNFAPMGWAIGASIGIARACSSGPVACITGDGAYLMSGYEITVAAEENLPVIFIILNDSAYGMVMHGQRLAGAEPIGYALPTINFSDVAKAMGIRSHTIEAADDFDKLDFNTILEQRLPMLLDVRIDREEVPPMITRLETLGTTKEPLAS